jgi:hypothetical protein
VKSKGEKVNQKYKQLKRTGKWDLLKSEKI